MEVNAASAGGRETKSLGFYLKSIKYRSWVKVLTNKNWFQLRSMSLNQHRNLRRCLMYALVVVDTIFNEILKVDIKMTIQWSLKFKWKSSD